MIWLVFGYRLHLQLESPSAWLSRSRELPLRRRYVYLGTLMFTEMGRWCGISASNVPSVLTQMEGDGDWKLSNRVMMNIVSRPVSLSRTSAAGLLSCAHQDDSGSRKQQVTMYSAISGHNVLTERKNYLRSQTGLSPIRSEIALNDKRK